MRLHLLLPDTAPQTKDIIIIGRGSVLRTWWLEPDTPLLRTGLGQLYVTELFVGALCLYIDY